MNPNKNFDIDKYFKENEEDINKVIRTMGILPPWLRYPDIPCGSIGWRMGPGETYIQDWLYWISTMTPEKRLKYLERYAHIPKEWRSWVIEFMKSNLHRLEYDFLA